MKYLILYVESEEGARYSIIMCFLLLVWIKMIVIMRQELLYNCCIILDKRCIQCVFIPIQNCLFLISGSTSIWIFCEVLLQLVLVLFLLIIVFYKVISELLNIIV